MELKFLIESANQAAGTQSALAKRLGVSSMQLTHAKAGRSGLPVSACFRLAEILEIDAKPVIAASELVTEKNPERRAVFAPFVTDSANDAILHRVKSGAKAVARASSLT